MAKAFWQTLQDYDKENIDPRTDKAPVTEEICDSRVALRFFFCFFFVFIVLWSHFRILTSPLHRSLYECTSSDTLDFPCTEQSLDSADYLDYLDSADSPEEQWNDVRVVISGSRHFRVVAPKTVQHSIQKESISSPRQKLPVMKSKQEPLTNTRRIGLRNIR